ncbi:MAG: YdcF family protein [Bacteroidetes bacterium]|nr:MAG: YdcF family protein [Bacteroidota bacterium]
MASRQWSRGQPLLQLKVQKRIDTPFRIFVIFAFRGFMFFFISKIVSFLFTPIFWVFSLLVAALFLKGPSRKRKALIGAIALFYFFSNSFILEEVSRIWEAPATHYKDLKTYDAGIVLGGMLSYDIQYDRIQFQRGADRLFQAVELYKTGSIKKIFFVGGSGSIEFAEMKEGMFVRRYLLTLGIPDADIWIENESRNTRENAVNAKEFLVKNNFDSGKFLLITSGHHMRRSLACFKVVGLDVTPYSVDRTASPERRFSPEHLLVPNVIALMWWNAVIHEWIGMVVYKIRGFA